MIISWLPWPLPVNLNGFTHITTLKNKEILFKRVWVLEAVQSW